MQNIYSNVDIYLPHAFIVVTYFEKLVFSIFHILYFKCIGIKIKFLTNFKGLSIWPEAALLLFIVKKT